MLSILLGILGMFVFSLWLSFMEIVVLVFIFSILGFFMMEWGMNIGIGEFLGVDLMSFLLVELSLWIGILMVIASMNLNVYSESMFKFYLAMMLFLLTFCFMILNLFGFYLLFESILIPIIMLIVGWGVQPERLQAGIYMLFYTLVGSLPLLLFLLIIYSGTSIFFMNWLNFNISSILFFMGVVGFLVKMPMYLVHLWLPKAHVEAPIAGSMVLAGVLLKLGVYGMYRVKVVLDAKMIEMGSLFISIVLIGGVIIGMICLCQVDVKSLIAYSSVAHMGLALGGIFSMSVWGFMGNILIMLGHGLCSSGLFCLANIFYERFYTRSMLLLKGVGIIFPFMSFWWFLFVSINMSAPPSMNLGGEIMLIGSLIKWDFLVMIPLMVLMFLSAGYSLYMYSYLNHGSGWVVYSVNSISLREIVLMFLHFCPLVMWIIKMEFFCLY
uniref:NADH-ubiquinone oxidoreductase chain 4 n=1 Tax=Nothoaspis amazoniensis TaxID=765744 RepID=A0A1P8LFZ6_9ACAR|nr:NADH dehydrogenase subunit 4 [Nothoaspis amazoniensis]APW83517.1 NADH dehydrogenase subunit 4 [Nothoaspis amazoniensis]